MPVAAAKLSLNRTQLNFSLSTASHPPERHSCYPVHELFTKKSDLIGLDDARQRIDVLFPTSLCRLQSACKRTASISAADL